MWWGQEFFGFCDCNWRLEIDGAARGRGVGARGGSGAGAGLGGLGGGSGWADFSFVTGRAGLGLKLTVSGAQRQQ